MSPVLQGCGGTGPYSHEFINLPHQFDGGCDGNAKASERWKIWLDAGFTSSADAQKPR